MDDDFEELLDLAFDVDPDETTRAELDQVLHEVIDDQTIDLLGRLNRVGIARGKPALIASPAVPPGRSIIDVPLMFALQAHPECTYQWARIVVDLSVTDGAVIYGMSPDNVQDVPVEVTTTIGVDLTLSTIAKAVDLGAHPEVSRKRTVYFPAIAATGTGFRQAYWDFYAKAGDYLHADKELRLYIDAPADVTVMARLTVRAKVRFRGFAQLIPLLARKGGIEPAAPVRLA